MSFYSHYVKNEQKSHQFNLYLLPIQDQTSRQSVLSKVLNNLQYNRKNVLFNLWYKDLCTYRLSNLQNQIVQSNVQYNLQYNRTNVLYNLLYKDLCTCRLSNLQDQISRQLNISTKQQLLLVNEGYQLSEEDDMEQFIGRANVESEIIFVYKV